MDKIRNKTRYKKSLYDARKRRTNTRIRQNSSLPRLVVKKSNKYMTATLIDTAGRVLYSYSDRFLSLSGTKTEKAYELGKYIANKLQDMGHTSIAFDRNGYIYHGRVRAVAEGARSGNLLF